MKNLRHLQSAQEAAQELHKLLLGTPWYIRTQVFTLRQAPSPVSDKLEKKEIVVYVRDIKASGSGPATFNTWPVRYELVS